MDLYYYPTSPPCLSVVLLTRELGLTPNLKVIDITAAEHMESEYREVSFAFTLVIKPQKSGEIHYYYRF